MINEYKGYSLFNDVENKELQTRNRAVIMCNIVEQYTKKDLITPKGAGLAMGYFRCIPEAERNDVNKSFEKMIKERGYARLANQK